MKRYIHILYTIVLLGITACVNDDFTQQTAVIDADGNKTLHFTANVPDMKRVATRAVDPDGLGLQTLYLYCFNEEGLFITRSLVKEWEGSVNGEGIYTGNFSAKVPAKTSIIHMIANLNDEQMIPSEHIGEREEAFIAGPLMETTSGRLGYWGRTVISDMEKVNITLYRNQAKITIDGSAVASEFTIEGFAICNTYANGTIAPYNQTSKFDWTPAAPFVTLPREPIIATDPKEVISIEANDTQYLFENNNESGNQAYVIMQGKATNGDSKFYKIMLVDDEKNPLPIYRNHHYKINLTMIPDADRYGVDSFEDAKASTTPALNNVWISIDNTIPSISDGKYTLDIIKTIYVSQTDNQVLEIPYTYTKNDPDASDVIEKPVVTWVTNDENAAEQTINNSFESSTGKGTIRITSHIGEDVRRATLMVKAGKLTREIKIITVNQFEFEQVWVSTNVYTGQIGQLVTLLFTIPDNFPEELLPLECMISANSIDPKEATPLRVVTKDEVEQYNHWGSDEFPLRADLEKIGITDTDILNEQAGSWNFKYIYTATQPGAQRVYFLTSFTQETMGYNATGGLVYVESELFNYASKTYTFSHSNKAIVIDDVCEYKGPSNDYYSPVQYKLVPPVTGTTVSVKFHFNMDNKKVTLEKDEPVILYVNNMNPLPGQGIGDPTSSNTSGGTYYTYTAEAGKDEYEVFFQTTSPNMDEVFRIASQEAEHYRSTSFELSMYKPFTFWNPNIADKESGNQEISYKQGSEVTISFTIKEEERKKDGTSGSGTDMITISPLGEGVQRNGFRCFIATEHLEPIDTDNIIAAEDKSGYWYTIYSLPEGEKTFNLRFKTKDIVSAETITLTADASQVAFNPVEMTLTNAPLTGEITYGPNDTGVKKDEFVVLERADGTRIGTFTITADGKYALTLRGEFQFGWEETLTVSYTDPENTIHQARTNLAELEQNKMIRLN